MSKAIMMKKTIPLLVIAFTLQVGSLNAATDPCDAKRAEIEAQITHARANNQREREAGLQTALAQVNAHCTKDDLINDAQDNVSKLEQKLAEKQQEIHDVEADKQKAQAEGDVKKIAKYDEKIDEKEQDINEIEAELNQAKTVLQGLKG